MSDTASTLQTPIPGRFRFSLGTLLLWTAIIALTAKSITTSRQVTQLKQEQARHLPLPPKEVASQFEKSTTLGTIATSVKDVRYSPEFDAYRVKFSWVDSDSGKTWHSDLRLNNDGFGVYSGQIRNGPFIQPLGYEKSFAVAVKTQSPFAD